jgi:transcription antitermination factor NusG
VKRSIGNKGLIPGNLLPDNEIEAWLTKRIPNVRKQTNDNPEFQNLKLTFELWLTGELSAEAQRRIAEVQATERPNLYTVKVMLARDIEESVKGFPDLQGVVKQHFLEHPMAAPIDVINPVSKRKISQAAARFSHLAHSDYGSEPTGADQSAA